MYKIPGEPRAADFFGKKKRKKKKIPLKSKHSHLAGKDKVKKRKEKKKNRVIKKKWRQVFGSTVFRKAK